MSSATKALIVGGGIAGLSAAIALRKSGVDCVVIDRGDPAVGASMSLSGRATDALEELGILEEAKRTGAPFTAQMASSPAERNAAGEPLGPPPPPPPPGAAPRLPVGVFRPQFADILRDAAKAEGVDIKTGVTVTTIEEVEDGVEVVASDGERHRADLCAVADGIWSETRRLLFPDAPAPEYAGQMSIRWMFEGDAVPGEGWYVAEPHGRLGFFHFPYQGMMYVPMVLNMPEQRLDQEQAFDVARDFLSRFTAPAIVGLRQHLRPDSTLIARPFQWVMVPTPWHRGRTLLIGDAAHATTAHMGMGAGMALEDGVVLAQCVKEASNVKEAFEMFEKRRYARVKTVVDTSLALSKMEQSGAPSIELMKTRGAAFAAIAKPY